MTGRLPVRANLALLATVVCFELAQISGVLADVAARSWPFAAMWVVAAALATPLRTALMHESLHARLLPGLWSSAAGRLLAASQVLSWEAVRWGHWTHHRWTRHRLDRPDLADAAIPPWRARIRHLAHLGGGAYLLSLGSSLALFLPVRTRCRLVRVVLHGDAHPMPRMRSAALALLRDSRRVGQARAEVAAGLLWHVLACSMWGAQWPVLAAGWVVRGLVVSLLDNVAHHGTEGQLGARARNLRLGPAWSMLLLHGNLHEVHHRQPELPWTDLPRVHSQAGAHFDGCYVAALLSQLRTPRAPSAG